MGHLSFCHYSLLPLLDLELDNNELSHLMQSNKYQTESLKINSLSLWSYQKIKCIMRRCIEILKINIVQSIDDNPLKHSRIRKSLSLYWLEVMMFSFVFVDTRSPANAFFFFFLSLALLVAEMFDSRRVDWSIRWTISIETIYLPKNQNQYQEISFVNEIQK